MRTFIQLKDGVGWASVNTTGEVEGAVEVEPGTGDFYIKKKYENGVWSDAPLIKWAEIDENGVILEVKRSYFSSEVDGPIMTPDIKVTLVWKNGQWSEPERAAKESSSTAE